MDLTLTSRYLGNVMIDVQLVYTLTATEISTTQPPTISCQALDVISHTVDE